MKDFIDIDIPFEEAENYFSPSNKEKLNTIFYKDRNYEKIKKDTTYFILGDKGSGKTTYAAYFCNGDRDGIKSSRYVLSVDDYGKIITMKEEGKLNYTSYTTMWKAILLIKILSAIDDAEVNTLFTTSKFFSAIKKTLKNFNYTKLTLDSFSPIKVIDNIGFINSFANSGQVGSSTANVSMTSTNSYNESHQVDESRMIYSDIWTKFINDIAENLPKIKLKNHHYLFVDGIDVRPFEIPLEAYHECSSSLVRAIYEVNYEILSQIKDTKKGRLKIILLSRLDIFLKAGLSNPGSKVADNCAFLNWSVSNEGEYRQSNIYALVNRLLSQGENQSDNPWQDYFNFSIKRGSSSFNSFVYFLRFTNCRPRDFVKVFSILSEMCSNSNMNNPSASQIESDKFQKAFSTYFADSIRTALSFYYTREQTKLLFDFIKAIRLTRFTYEQFGIAYSNFVKKEDLEKTFGGVEQIIQLLFEHNIVCLYEQNGYYRWKYREISISNYDYGLAVEDLNPNTKFVIHWALEKDFGAYLK